MAKMKKINWKSKKTWKNALIIGLACITIVGAVVGLSALFRKSEETTKEINPTYAVGGLTEDGRYKETEESIYTKDAFECQGIDVSLAFDSNVSYRIFFYDKDNDFISATSKQIGNYDENTTPFQASYARIVITPNEDDKISWYEKSGYAKQLTISVDKEQKDVEVLHKGSNKLVYVPNCSISMSAGTSGFSLDTSKQQFNSSELILFDNVNKVCIKADTSLLSQVDVSFLTESAFGSRVKLDGISGDFVEIDDVTYISFDVPTDSAGFVVHSDLGVDFSSCEIYAW